MNTHLDHQLLLVLGKGFLLSAGLVLLGALVLRGRSAQTASHYWRGGVLALLLLPVVSIGFPWLSVSVPAGDAPESGGPAVAVSPGAPAPPVAESASTSTHDDAAPLVAVSAAETGPIIEAAPGERSSGQVFATENPAPSAPPVASGEVPDWRALAGRALLILWGIGALVVIARWWAAWRRVARLAKHAEACDWSGDLAALGMEEGRVRTAISPEISSPLVWGIRGSVLVLPSDSPEWDDEKRRQVLGHELCHVRRRDALFLLLARLAVALHWMNPLAWLVSRKLRLADERTADDAVLVTGGDPGRYAGLLAAFARRKVLGGEVAAAQMANESTVQHRVQRILDARQRRGAPRPAARLALAVVVGVSLLVAGGLSPGQRPADERSQSPQKQGENEPRAGDENAGATRPDTPDEENESGPGGGAEEAVVITPEEAAINFITQKAKHIILPAVDFDDAPLEEVVDFLRLRARELDHIEADPERKGLNFVIVGDDLPQRKVPSLRLRNVPLSTVLEFVSQQTNTKHEYGEFAISFTDGKGVPGKAPAPNGHVTKIYRVPPTFIDDLRTDFEDGQPDPFGPAAGKAERAGVQLWLAKYLKKKGVEFPKGASAAFVAAESKLIVSAPVEIHALIDELVQAVISAMPSIVKVRYELFEVSNDDALRISKIDEKQNSGAVAYELVQDLRDKKRATLLAAPAAVARPGQKVSVKFGSDETFIKAYENKEGVDQPVTDSVFVGTRIDVEPNVGARDRVLDIRSSIYMTRGELKRTTRKVKAPVSGKEVEVESLTIDTFNIPSIGTTTIKGQTQLLGLMRSSARGKETAVAVFMTANLTKVREDN